MPYDAIKTFVDPSVEFGLRFEAQEGAEDASANMAVLEHPDQPEPVADAAADNPPTKAEKKGAADVVSLDSFRK